MNMHGRFDKFARWASWATGKPWSFAIALSIVLVWIITGPIFHYSDTWQLFINTGTTIVTFIMVFLIQSSQNRDTGAIQVKLDELIRATLGAHNAIIGLEEIDEQEFERIRKNYEHLAKLARVCRDRGDCDTDQPEVEAVEELRDEVQALNQQLGSRSPTTKQAAGH
jgi:low affinity Fe/Cu permease